MSDLYGDVGGRDHGSILVGCGGNGLEAYDRMIVDDAVSNGRYIYIAWTWKLDAFSRAGHVFW